MNRREFLGMVALAAVFCGMPLLADAWLQSKDGNTPSVLAGEASPVAEQRVARGGCELSVTLDFGRETESCGIRWRPAPEKTERAKRSQGRGW